MLNCNIFVRVCTDYWMIPSKPPIDSSETQSTTEPDYSYEKDK